MKLLLTEGCVCWSFLIDDVNASDISLDKLKSIIFTTIDNISNKPYLINIIHYLMIDADISTSTVDYDLGPGEPHYTEYAINSSRFGDILLKESFSEDSSLTVCGKDMLEMSEEDIRDVIKNIIEENVFDAGVLTSMLIDLIRVFGEYKFCYHCDECGDDVVEYKWEV